MTIEDLPRLTPRQQIVIRLVEFEGLTAAQAAARLGGHWNRNAVAAAAYQARRRLRTGFVPRQKQPTCARGHERVPGAKRCKLCVKLVRGGLGGRTELEPRESRAASEERIKREIAAGKRCARCWLLSPCHDHERSRP